MKPGVNFAPFIFRQRVSLDAIDGEKGTYPLVW
jgi:hypothetical protein